MADDCIREEIITNFFLETCQPRRHMSENDVCALLYCAGLAQQLTNDRIIPLLTGSLAELYVDPMLSCVGDVDIMAHHGSYLAIPEGYPPPTQLPGQFNSRVNVYEIVNSEFPGYVYLLQSYLLTECEDDGKYKAVQCERVGLIAGRDSDADVSMHGPAFFYEVPRNSVTADYCATIELRWSADFVFCARCLIWPPQAADWPTRHRHYSWPDSTTVDRVVRNGCDVVAVAHPLCRQHEWMNKRQWRLSFSRAEIVLLNSWMPIQQIVYHMLRVFMKTTRLIDSAAANNTGADTLSNYHIKTLMLWACELKSRIWWTDDLNLVTICVELLHTLAVWLTEIRCQYYFINDCNLFDRFEHSQFTEVTANQLMLITRAWFCEWCIDSYLCKCIQLCHSRVQRLMPPSMRLHDVVCLQNTVSKIVLWRRVSLPLQTAMHHWMAQFTIMHYVSEGLITFQSFLSCRDQLAKSEQVLQLYVTAVVFLHVAYKTTQGSLTDEMLDVLATTVCRQSNDVRHCLKARHSSVLSLSQAAILMKVVANNSCSTVQLIEIELAKAYLHRALRCHDSEKSSIYCLANVYLAVLYYSTGQYQVAIDHCTHVMMLQDHSQCSSHVVQGELLNRIDDQVDNILGLAVFYQYIQASALKEEQERRRIIVFTTELFARYLHIKLLSMTKCHQLSQTSLTGEIKQYQNCFHDSPEVFVTDAMLCNLANRTKYLSKDPLMKVDKGETKSVTLQQLDTSNLVELLQQSAVDYLAACRELQTPEFGFKFIVTPDFKALYAYKRGQYERCLKLSVHSVCNMTTGINFIMLSANFMILFPELIQLMDDDIVSLIGLMTLVKSPHESGDPFIPIHQPSLSLYLMTQCQIKLRHSVTSLARTFNYVQITRGMFRECNESMYACDQIVLKFVEQKIMRYYRQ